MKKICIIGSINLDMVVENEHFVKPGETVTGLNFFTSFGGKGANQAIACARLSGVNSGVANKHISFIGMVGEDVNGRECLTNLKTAGINVSHIELGKSNTGIALIELEQSGENRITVVPGCNGLIDKPFIDNNIDFILEHDVFLLQNEIPLEINYYIFNILSEQGKTIIFDPAPADGIDINRLAICNSYVNYDKSSLCESRCFITPNESELMSLCGNIGMKKQMEFLQNKGFIVILKAGAEGAYILSEGEPVNYPACHYGKCIDTTGAGDTFNGALAFAIAEGYNIHDSILHANKAAGYSVTRKGAQVGMPLMEDIV